MPKEEKEILALGLQKGDEKAYQTLYETHYDSLVHYCHNLTNNLQQAEDIVQNVLVKIWENKDAIKIKTSLKSYLYKAVFNEFVKEKGKLQKREKMLLELKRDVLDYIIDMDKDIIQKKMKLLESIIEELPQKRKTVFLLHKKEGYKYKEIANELGLSEKTVEKHISRAMKQIRETFKKGIPKIFS